MNMFPGNASVTAIVLFRKLRERGFFFARLALLACLIAVITGCSGVGSVNPAYTKRDLVSLPKILGTWSDKPDGDSHDVAVIAEAGPKAYKLSFRMGDDDNLVTWDLHLTKIGDALFADAFSEKCGVDDDSGMMMPVHMVAKCEITGDVLRVYPLNAAWLNAYLRRHPSAVQHVMYDKKDDAFRWVYLTGSTRRVRAFLKKHSKTVEAFNPEDAMVMHKISDAQDAPPPKAEPAATDEAVNLGGAPT